MSYIEDIDTMITELEETKNAIKMILDQTDNMVKACVDAGVKENEVKNVFRVVFNAVTEQTKE